MMCFHRFVFQYHARSMTYSNSQQAPASSEFLPHPATQALPNHKIPQVVLACPRMSQASAAGRFGPDFREARGASLPTTSKSERGMRPGPREPHPPYVGLKRLGVEGPKGDMKTRMVRMSGAWGLNSLLHRGVETSVELGDVREL